MTNPATHELISRDYCVLTPSYGRDYKSAAAAKQDFLHGKDFTINDVQYGYTQCSIRDFAPNTAVNIRYKKLTQVCIVRVLS